MDKIPLKIFELAVAALDTENIPKDNTVFIDKEVLYSFFNATDEDRHTRFRKHIGKLHSQAVFHIRVESEKDVEFEVFSGVAKTSWSRKNPVVSIKFTDEIMVFLTDFVKGKFTQYNISNISSMESKHSITIYKWLTMNYNQYKAYQFRMDRTAKQKEILKNPEISIEQLREITDTKKKYKEFSNFEKRVLKEPLKEINEQTDLNVTYEKIKKGRNNVAIKFYITEKPIKKAVPLDEGYFEDRPSKEERERILAEKRDKALDSDYTGLLLEYHLIKFTDLKNKHMLAEFYEYLYPVYDRLEQLKGRNEKLGLNAHLRHMQNELSKKSEQPKDLLKYLKTSAENFVDRIKSEGL